MSASFRHQASLQWPDLDFESFRRLSRKRLEDNGIKPGSTEDNALYEQTGRGRAILETEDQVDKYIHAFGKKHFLKFKRVFESVPREVIGEERMIDLVDWGCGAGLAILALHDYMHNKLSREGEHLVRTITLVEPSKVALERAEDYSRVLFPEAKIIPICKRFEELTGSEFDSYALGVPRVHLFSNVLDLNVFDDSAIWGRFFKLIQKYFSYDEYFLLASPDYGNAKATFDRFFQEIDRQQHEKKILVEPKAEQLCADNTAAPSVVGVIKIIRNCVPLKLSTIKNRPLYDELNLRRDSTPAQRLLVSKICTSFSSEQCTALFRPNLMGVEPDLLLIQEKKKAQLVFACEGDCNKTAVEHAKRNLEVAVQLKNRIYKLLSKELCIEAERNISIFGAIQIVLFFTNEGLDLNKFQEHLDKELRLEKEYTTLSKALQYAVFVQENHKEWPLSYSGFITGDILDELKNLGAGYSSDKIKIEPPKLDKRQSDLARSRPLEQKIFGVFGSGKTTLLIARAVDAYKRTRETVLILTFNITLRNYIEFLLKQYFGPFSRHQFYVVNYHEFVRGELVWANIDPKGISFSKKEDMGLHADCLNRKYSSIFVDEAQDYKLEWMEIIKTHFLATNGEYVLFGDEKQNIYGNALDGLKIRTNVKGQPNKLTACYRSNSKIIEMIRKYQREIFAERYDIDEFEKVKEAQAEIIFNAGLIKLIPCQRNVPEITKKIVDYLHYAKAKAGSTSILASERQLLREVDFLYREQTESETEVTFLRKEEADDGGIENEGGEIHGQDSDRAIKLNFDFVKDATKLSTTHSFKGYEADTIILLLTSSQNPETEKELIYTGLTRAKSNLLILAIDSPHYEYDLKRILMASPEFSIPITAPVSSNQ